MGARPRKRVILVLAPSSSTKTSRAGGFPANPSCQWALASATSGRCCSVANSVFFIRQTQLAQPQVHRGSAKRTIQPRAQLGQGGIRLPLDQLLQAGLAAGRQQRFASTQMGLRLECAALLELLPDPAHGCHTETQTLRDLTGAFALLIEPDDALARGKRYRSHGGLYQPSSPM